MGERVLGAVAAFGSGAIADVTSEQHLALLSFLCDEALDTLLLHNLLQSAQTPRRPELCFGRVSHTTLYSCTSGCGLSVMAFSSSKLFESGWSANS